MNKPLFREQKGKQMINGNDVTDYIRERDKWARIEKWAWEILIALLIVVATLFWAVSCEVVL